MAILVGSGTRATRALQEQVAENREAIRALQEQVRDMQKVLEKHSEEIARLSRSIQALGARWGILAESAFREGMTGLIERYFGGKVRSWACYDEEGFVSGHPSVIEVDLLVTDGEHILIEVKSSASRADVFELWRVGQLYARKTGIRPRLVLVAPFVDEKAKKVAKELGIDVLSGLEF